MLNWEPHRKTLHGLYITKTISETKEHMESNYGFKATLAQYHTQFKKWNFQKNMKKNDWVYISRKLTQRGQRESVVYHEGILVPFNKVRKNISRHVHPNDAFKLDIPPPSPGNIIVRSPSPFLDTVSRPGSPYTSTYMGRTRENSSSGPSSSKRQRLMVLNDLTFQSTQSIDLLNLRTWNNAFCVLQDVDLSGLPYFRLRDMLDSEDVKRGFQDILTLNDPLCGNIVGHFWPETSTPMQNLLLSDSPYDGIDMCMGDDLEILFHNPYPMPKPFGIALLRNNAFDTDGIVHQTLMVPKLTSFLANIPCKDDKEVQALRDLLLGPPTIEAARRLVEIGIYIVSNHLDELWPMGDFIETVLQSISWRVLRRVLLVEAPSVQAFSERVFLHAITTQSLHVVEDLLRHKFIEATVISNGLALVSAVRTSNCELVSMILDAGACPNKIAFGNLPLTETRDVHVARLVLEAGADINSFASIIFIGKYMLSHVTALAVATASKNIDLVRYLIEKGADVNLHSGWERKENSTTMLAVESGIIEILQMLLQAGSRPDEVSRTLSRMTPLQKAGTRPNEASKMHYQLMTPLQKAALIGDIEAVRLLIKYGGDVNAPAFGTSGATALQAAVSQGDVEMTKVLLENGAEVNIPSNSDAKFPHSLLTTAVEMNHPELVKIILDAGAEVNISSFGYYGCTPLESAMYLPHGSDICDLLVGRGAQHNTLSNNEYRQVQLRKAVWAEDLVRVKVLLGTGMKIDMSPIEDSPYRESHNIRLLEERSILQDAIITGSAVFQLLFDVIKSYNDDVDFHPLLVEAIRVKNVEIRTTLLDAGANINSTHCHAGKLIGTPLMFAVWKNDFEAVRFLYHKGADVNVVAKGFHLSDFRRASTALQISLWHAEYERASFEMFHFLRHHGATINAPIARKYGLSELASAVTTGDLAIVQELLDAGANVNSPPAEVGGRTALQAAADLYSAKIEMVQLLLQRRADVNALPACRYGITALGAAAKGGLFQVALILLKAGADVNAEFYSYGPSTSLREAASWGRLDMVHLLLKAGADPHLPKDERYVRAAEDARRRGHIAITTILENWKVDEVLECALSTAVPQAEGESLVIELE